MPSAPTGDSAKGSKLLSAISCPASSAAETFHFAAAWISVSRKRGGTKLGRVSPPGGAPSSRVAPTELPASEHGGGPCVSPTCQASQLYRWRNPKRVACASIQPYADSGPRSSSVAHRWREVPGGATHFGSGCAANSSACSASERKPETTISVMPSSAAAATILSYAAATSGLIPWPSR